MSTQFTSMRSARASSALAAAVAASLASVAYAAPTVDGTLDAGLYTRFATQTVQTGFGDNNSELDAGYYRIEGGKLYLMLTGNVESNGNKLVIFFDTRAGGQNVVRNDNPGVDFGALNGKYAGMTFDAGFSPDYGFWFSRYTGPDNAYPHLTEMNTNGGGSGWELGSVPITAGQGAAQLGGTNGVPSVGFGYNDANLGGVTGGSAAGDATAAEAVTTGTELSFDLTSLGITGNFNIMVGINGSNHDYWSNQFLPGLNAPQGNLGSDGNGNFIAPGSVSAVNFETQIAGNQYLQLNYTAPAFRWNNAGNGNWSDATKWTPNTGTPNAPDAIATLDSTAGSAARTITLDTNVQLQKLVFDSTGTYTIAPSGGNALAIAGNPATPAIQVISGSHAIGAPLNLGNTTNITVAAGSALDVTGDLTANNNVIVKHGDGQVQFKNVRTSSAFISEGTLKIASNGTTAGTSKLAVLFGGGTLTPNGALDLDNNDLVTSTALADVEALIKVGRNSGAWTGKGITSTAARNLSTTGLAAISGADYSVVNPSANGTFSGQAYADSDTLVKYTWNGDANLDGRVTFDDYVKIDTGFNVQVTGWINGDFNYSGNVSFDDYVLIDIAFNQQNGTLGRAVNWISGDDRSAAGLDSPGMSEVLQHLDQFGANYGAAFLAAVPEPTSFALLGVPALAGIVRRRRKTSAC